MSSTLLSFKNRAHYCTSPLAKRLFSLMEEKRSNLALSADVTSADKLLSLAATLGPEICIFKTHIDIIEDFSLDITQQLQALAEKHHFFIFEDRKFADIGNTVKHQYRGGMYRIANWAHMVNAHCLPGEGVIQGLAEIGAAKQRGLILIAEMSSAGQLMDKNYTLQVLKMAKQYPDFVIGFISQHSLTTEPQWINMTPGIQLEGKNDGLGQQYHTPHEAILEHGTDIIIVGRGILAAQNPLKTTQQYRAEAWKAYSTRCTRSLCE